MRRSLATVAFAVLVTGACGGPEAPPPVVVFALDGADWSVIRQLWERGELPHLEALADRGVATELRSGYDSKSPVVWTSIATGVVAERHGIIDFVVPTDRGQVPLTSTLRRVPAIWNMLDAAGRRAAVLGWWASWPVEEVDGLIVSDRVLVDAGLRVWPPDRTAEVDALVREVEQAPTDLPDNARATTDRLAFRLAAGIADEPFDLVLIYVKSLDVLSHGYWKYFRPGKAGPLRAGERERYGDHVPGAYRAVDRMIGEVVAAYGPEVRYLVVSDHGFYGLPRERVKAIFNFDRLLAALGFLTYDADGVDLAASRLYSYGSAPGDQFRGVRCVLAGRETGGTLTPAECEEVLGELDSALDEIHWSTGTPAFARPGAGRQVDGGGDFVVRVVTRDIEPPLVRDGVELPVTVSLRRISGSHGAGTPGIFILAGPGVAAPAEPRRVDLHDVTPTLLYALGLPVAEDFDGSARTDLFDAEFARRFPLSTVASWGQRGGGDAIATEADERLLDELRALGYLD